MSHTDVTISHIGLILLFVVDFTYFYLCANFQHPMFTNKGINSPGGGGAKHPETHTLTEDHSPNRVNPKSDAKPHSS